MSSTEASARRRAERLASGDLCSESGCPNPRATRGLCKTHYNRATGNGWDGYTQDVEKRRATWRAKNHRRRQVSRAAYDELTPARELELRQKAKRCPMPNCGVKLIDEPYLPQSKELDHKIPRGVGGTHTEGNVRIICRLCNLRRPKDGSDYIGPVTLWAQDHIVAGDKRSHVRPRNVCECGARKRNGRCYICQPVVVKSRQSDGCRAAELRAVGWAWKDIAAEVGFAVGNVATYARKWGDPEVVAKWHVDVPRCQSCRVDLPHGGRGRPRKYCVQCRPPIETMEAA